jgi:hypothetical protein
MNFERFNWLALSDTKSYKKCMEVIRSRSESLKYTFDYNDLYDGKTVPWLNYFTQGMRINNSIEVHLIKSNII